jgi:hypothetical protein
LWRKFGESSGETLDTFKPFKADPSGLSQIFDELLD